MTPVILQYDCVRLRACPEKTGRVVSVLGDQVLVDFAHAESMVVKTNLLELAPGTQEVMEA